MKYLLDLTQLQQGDIVLEAGETPLISEMIKKATKSDYSHAMIYIDHTLIHAVKKGGVFSKNPQRILLSSKDSFKVLRLKDPSLQSKLKSVCKNARAKVGSLYSTSEAGKSAWPNKTQGKNRKQFCSRLVAQSYSESGIELVNNPDYCTPEDINNSAMLEVVNGCVREATEQDIEMESREDPNLENQEQTFKWLKLARDYLKKENVDIQTINDVGEHLAKDRSSDKRICKFIESTKYLELYNVDRRLNPYRYNIHEFMQKMQTVLNHDELIESEVDLNRRELERHGESLVVARQNYRNVNLKFTKLHMRLYRNLLLETESRLKVISQYKFIDDQTLRNVNKYLSETSALVRQN